ncbi:hypothetical protein GCM10025868_07090 [Angustibacter aerolatus]|uniref:Uncharacterized protein n=1 Tax=Angustibacter aerolatus TaxID=1162965 RepID=A0ABQ6JE88_9ACTN|nr:hypothetical protein GCM10025868_07090 [Angustibacter aerolatus]
MVVAMPHDRPSPSGSSCTAEQAALAVACTRVRPCPGTRATNSSPPVRATRLPGRVAKWLLSRPAVLRMSLVAGS